MSLTAFIRRIHLGDTQIPLLSSQSLEQLAAQFLIANLDFPNGVAAPL